MAVIVDIEWDDSFLALGDFEPSRPFFSFGVFEDGVAVGC